MAVLGMKMLILVLYIAVSVTIYVIDAFTVLYVIQARYLWKLCLFRPENWLFEKNYISELALHEHDYPFVCEF